MNIVIEVTWRVKQFLDAQMILSSIGLDYVVQKHLLKQWSPLELGWIKINLDGAYVNGGRGTTCGGVLRDDFRCWIQGYYSHTGRRGGLSTKLWAAFHGLDVAWDIFVKSSWKWT